MVDKAEFDRLVVLNETFSRRAKNYATFSLALFGLGVGSLMYNSKDFGYRVLGVSSVSLGVVTAGICALYDDKRRNNEMIISSLEKDVMSTGLDNDD